MAVYRGSSGDDSYTGTPSTDIIYGGQGNDNLKGEGANDFIYGEDVVSPNSDRGLDIGETYEFTYINNTSTTVWIWSSTRDGSKFPLFSIEAGETYVEDVYKTGARYAAAADGSVYYFKTKGSNDTTTTSFTFKPADDILDGGDGDDQILGQLGNDVITGGAGDDQLWGDVGIDTIYGDSGDDIINAGDDNDEVYGGDGNDEIGGGNGEDTIFGDAGEDSIRGGDGADEIYGGSGNDEIYGDAGNDKIFGDSGDDFIEGSLGNDEIDGGLGDDTIDGGEGDDTILGRQGIDTITGGFGADKIFGGSGDDKLAGGFGNDEINGELGNDRIEGGLGSDTIKGGAGTDLIFGNTEESATASNVVIELGTVQLNNILVPRPDDGYLLNGYRGTPFQVEGETYIAIDYRTYDSALGIYKLTDDGLLEQTDLMIYQDGNGLSPDDPNYLKPYVQTTSGGDITSSIPPENFRAFGNSIADIKVVEIDGVTTMFVNSQNGSGITAWEINAGGTMDYVASIQYGGSQPNQDGGFTREQEMFTLDDGTVVFYGSRAQNNFISRVEYDPDTKTLTKDDWQVDRAVDSPTGGGINGLQVFSVDGTDYLASSAQFGFDVYEINSANGDLTLKTQVVATTTGSVINSTNLFVNSDGVQYLTYSNSNAEEVVLYRINDDGTFTETDTLIGQGDFFSDSTLNFDVAGSAVIIVPDISGEKTRLYTVDENGAFNLQAQIEGFGESNTAPFITTTGSGNDFIVNPITGQTVPLAFGIGGSIDEDIIDGGSGDDIMHGQIGNDTITVGVGDQAFGEADRDTFIIDKDQVGTGTVFNVDGGDTSTAPDGVDDYDSVVFGDGLTVVDNTFRATIDDDPDSPYISYTGTIDVTDGTNVYTVNFKEIENIICFTRGTKIITDRGEIAVEDIVLGERVLTKDNGFKPVKWIGSRVMDKQTLVANPKIYPIRISAGALGHNYPANDLIVSPQHRILLNSMIAGRMFGCNEILVPAVHLLPVKGVDVITDCDAVEYFHFLFDQHEIVFANRAQAESLFTGPEALATVSEDAREEILTIFPELNDASFDAPHARYVPSGRRSKELVARHLKNERSFYSSDLSNLQL